MSQLAYKGYTIALIPSQEGYMWTCEYVIRKSDQTDIQGVPDGNTYQSREQAESEALAKAKALIDEAAFHNEPLESG